MQSFILNIHPECHSEIIKAANIYDALAYAIEKYAIEPIKNVSCTKNLVAYSSKQTFVVTKMIF